MGDFAELFSAAYHNFGKYFLSIQTRRHLFRCPCCFLRPRPSYHLTPSHNSRNPRYTSSTSVPVVPVNGACRCNTPVAVQGAFYLLSSGHAEISLPPIRVRGNTRDCHPDGEKDEKNENPFPIVVISPAPFNSTEVPRYFRFRPVPRIASISFFHFISEGSPSVWINIARSILLLLSSPKAGRTPFAMFFIRSPYARQYISAFSMEFFNRLLVRVSLQNLLYTCFENIIKLTMFHWRIPEYIY